MPVERLEVVTLGVSKKATAAFVAFEFRLRTVSAVSAIPAGQRLVWSCIFPLKPGTDISAEGFLHLPQKQQFTANLFLEGNGVVIQNAAVALDEQGGRISLTDHSKVTAGAAFTDWDQFQEWNAAAALERIHSHWPTPLDLEVELQEEVVLQEWQVGASTEREEGQVVYPITSGPMAFDAVVSRGAEGKALRLALESFRKKQTRPPLFGLLHYEKCRLVLQPLAVFGADGPEQLMLSSEKVDRAALLKALKF
ncbi:MAG TPA: hypothetical protein VFA18_04200 [Gemmataceae bacterium]|nr:hypothetical protein [Gemmataceae bacterium]